MSYPADVSAAKYTASPQILIVHGVGVGVGARVGQAGPAHRQEIRAAPQAGPHPHPPTGRKRNPLGVLPTPALRPLISLGEDANRSVSSFQEQMGTFRCPRVPAVESPSLPFLLCVQ